MFSAPLAAGEVSVLLALFLVHSCQNLDPVDPKQFHHHCGTESHCYSAKRVRERSTRPKIHEYYTPDGNKVKNK